MDRYSRFKLPIGQPPDPGRQRQLQHTFNLVSQFYLALRSLCNLLVENDSFFVVLFDVSPAQPHLAIPASPACINGLDLLFFGQQKCKRGRLLGYGGADIAFSLLLVEHPHGPGANLVVSDLPSLAALRTDDVVALVTAPLGQA